MNLFPYAQAKISCALGWPVARPLELGGSSMRALHPLLPTPVLFVRQWLGETRKRFGDGP